MAKSRKPNSLYLNIEWLMPNIDVRSVIERMGQQVERASGDEYFTFCPDHFLFTGREPSHPKWTVNAKTGRTYCFTEGRGSNLLFTIVRLHRCSPREAIMWLTGENSGNIDNYELHAVKRRLKTFEKEEKNGTTVKNLHNIQEEMNSGILYDSGYDFFECPPGKKPTHINRETVKHFKVFQRQWGFYNNRVIIPAIVKGEIKGFEAIDILGKEKWLEKHPNLKEKDYKKVLFPSGMKTNDCIFNFDGIPQNSERVIITEGSREAMKLWQEGFKEAGGIYGKSISSTQIKLLSEKAPKNVYLMFDGDRAGYDATEKNAKKLQEIFSVYKVEVKRGYDPKNLSQKEIEKCIKKAKKVFTNK